MTKVFVFIVLFLFPAIFFAQSPVFRNYSTRNGLPSNEVFQVYQDSKGFIWACTNSGVSKFDGYKFRNFDRSSGLPDNVVFNIYEDYSGKIWFLPLSNKLSYFFKDSIFQYPFNDTLTKIIKGTKPMVKNSFFVSEKGVVSFGIRSSGFFEISPNGTYKISFTDSLESNYLFNKSGKVIYVSTVSKNMSLRYYLNDRYCPIDSLCWKTTGAFPLTVLMKNGHVLFAADNEVLEIIDGKSVKRHSIFATVIWLYVDKHGGVWIGTSKNGVKYYKNGNLNSKPEHYFKSLSVTGIICDTEGGVWLSTLEEGLFYTSGLEFKTFTMDDGLAAKKITCLSVDQNNNLLAGTAVSVIHQFMKNSNIKTILMKESKDLYINCFLQIDKTIYYGSNKFIGSIDNKILQDDKREAVLSYIDTNKTSALCLLSGDSNEIWIGGSWVFGKTCRTFSKCKTEYFHRSIRCLALEKNDKGAVYIGTPNGLMIYKDGKFIEGNTLNPVFNERISKIINLDNGIFAFGTKGAGLLLLDEKRLLLKKISSKDGLTGNTITALYREGNELWIGTESGLNKMIIPLFTDTVYRIEKYTIETGLPTNEVNDIVIQDSIVWIASNSGVTRFNRYNVSRVFPAPPVYLLGFTVNQKKTALKNSYELTYDQNFLVFDFVGLSYRNAGNLTYKYKMQGLSDEWIRTSVSQVMFPFLPHGEYIFTLIALNNEGLESPNPLTIHITILPPFWKTKWFMAIVLLLIAACIYAYIKMREKKLIAEKLKLENLVIERTKEVVMQNEEISIQKEEILAQRDELQLQKDIVEEKNRDITSSIEYAHRIQQAVLPSDDFLKNTFAAVGLQDFFILFKPKDIVSGDFYFIERRKEMLLIAVADCTGHGVPGGFMSMLGISFLHEIIAREEVFSAAHVLDELRKSVITSLQQEPNIENTFSREMKIRDGMDISFVALNTKTLELQFAGANNPIYIVPLRHGAMPQLLNEIRPDKQPIGIYENMKPFTNNVLQLQKGDIIYLISDGYQDQFGGSLSDKGKKFRTKQLIQVLEKRCSLSMELQKQALDATMHQRMFGHGFRHEQTDDITVVGIRI